MLKMIVGFSFNGRVGFIRLDLSTLTLVLQSELLNATFFTSDFSKELRISLGKARKAFPGYNFKSVDIQECNVRGSRILKRHFSSL